MVKEIKVLRKTDDAFTLSINLDSSEYKYRISGFYTKNIDNENLIIIWD